MLDSRLAPSFFLVALFACSTEHASSAPERPDADVSDAGAPPIGRDAALPRSDAGDALEGSIDAALPDAALPALPDVGPPPVPEACPEMTEGLNAIQLGGRERRFWVSSPPSSGTPRAAVFWFHGYSGTRSPHDDALADSATLDAIGIRPDADPGFPFVRVLLEDTNLQPFAGLDWDIRTDEPNVDLVLFDTVVECLIAHRAVARDRIFAAGFSAGATFVNLLHTARGDVVRAVYTASGLWINEPANLSAARRVTVIPSLVAWDWPELGAIELGAGAVMLSYGGANDNVPGSPVRVNLSDAGRAAADWLVANGRVVVVCEHGGGHTLHPELNGEVVLRFFAAHVGDAPSPWLRGAAPTLPASCTLRRP